jgi:hypothetical protein
VPTVLKAADAVKMDLAASKAVLEKLKADGTIKQYKLEPLAGDLLQLDLSHSGIVDLSALKGMPLESQDLFGVKATDLGPLRGLPLPELRLACPQDPRELDLTPLAECKQIEVLDFTPTARTTGLQAIRDHPKVKTINGQPAGEFWKKLDAARRKGNP